MPASRRRAAAPIDVALDGVLGLGAADAVRRRSRRRARRRAGGTQTAPIERAGSAPPSSARPAQHESGTPSSRLSRSSRGRVDRSVISRGTLGRARVRRTAAGRRPLRVGRAPLPATRAAGVAARQLEVQHRRGQRRERRGEHAEDHASRRSRRRCRPTRPPHSIAEPTTSTSTTARRSRRTPASRCRARARGCGQRAQAGRALEHDTGAATDQIVIRIRPGNDDQEEADRRSPIAGDDADEDQLADHGRGRAQQLARRCGRAARPGRRRPAPRPSP